MKLSSFELCTNYRTRTKAYMSTYPEEWSRFRRRRSDFSRLKQLRLTTPAAGRIDFVFVFVLQCQSLLPINYCILVQKAYDACWSNLIQLSLSRKYEAFFVLFLCFSKLKHDEIYADHLWCQRSTLDYHHLAYVMPELQQGVAVDAAD